MFGRKLLDIYKNKRLEPIGRNLGKAVEVLQ